MSFVMMAFDAAEPSAAVVLSLVQSCHKLPESECQASSKRYFSKPCLMNRAYLKYHLLSVGNGLERAVNNAGSCVQVHREERSPPGHVTGNGVMVLLFAVFNKPASRFTDGRLRSREENNLSPVTQEVNGDPASPDFRPMRFPPLFRQILQRKCPPSLPSKSFL